MFDSESVPKNVPEAGFYYHYKHVPEGSENDHAYELVGVGYHTETGEHSVVYRPLYEDAWAYQNGKLVYVRPLEMFMDTVQKNEYAGPRFIKIGDPELIERLSAVRDELYP